MPFTLFLVLLFSSVSFGAKPELSDEHIRTKLVATWLPSEDRTVSGEVTYNKDFTFEGFVLSKLPDKMHWKFAGKWKVKDGRLTYEYTKSSIPDLFPVGTVMTDRVVSITDKELVSVTEKGKKQICIRKEK